MTKQPLSQEWPHTRRVAIAALVLTTWACQERAPEQKVAPQEQVGMDAPVTPEALGGPPPSRAYWYLARGSELHGPDASGEQLAMVSAGATYEPETDWHAIGFSCWPQSRRIEVHDYGSSGSPTRTQLRIPSASITVPGSAEAWPTDEIAFTAFAPASDPFWRAFLDRADSFAIRTEGWEEEVFLWDPKIATVLRACGV